MEAKTVMVNKGKKKKSHEARCKIIKWALVVSDTAYARLQSAFLQLIFMCSRLGNFLVCYEESFFFFAPAIQLLNCYHIANDLSPHLLLNVYYKQCFSFSLLRGNTEAALQAQTHASPTQWMRLYWQIPRHSSNLVLTHRTITWKCALQPRGLCSSVGECCNSNTCI